MIARVRLVAWYEFRAQVLRRVFLFLLLAPLLYVVGVLALAGGGAVATVALVASDVPVDRRPRVELVDGAGIGPAAHAALDGTVRLEEAPADGARERPLPEGVAGRVIVGPDALDTGRYVLVAGVQDGVAFEGITAGVGRALAETRLVRAGVAPAVARVALDVTVERRVSRAAFEQVLPQLRGGVALVVHFMVSMASSGGVAASGVADKSSRVAEVLLGAVSPGELLAGRLLGYLGAAIVLSWSWIGQLLLPLALSGLQVVGPGVVAAGSLLIVLAAVPLSAAVAALGSLADDPRDAQRLTMPAVLGCLALYLPALLALGRPDAALVRVASLVPPTASPVMLARLCGPSPPGWGEVALAVVGSAAFAVPVVALAARIYGVGLLSRGGFPGLRATWRLVWQL